MHWDPTKYGEFAGERGRPFLDLISRIAIEAPRRVVDLGCGPGNLTTLLSRRWPNASVEGIDASAEMIAVASADGPAGPAFRVQRAQDWQPAADVDVVVSNAALQWVPGHQDLLRDWSGKLGSGSWLAWQVPGNFGAPSHTLMRTLAESPRWADQLAGTLDVHRSVLEPADYAELLLDAGFSADVWESTYLHLLPGPDPVLEWVRGTGLRPILAALSPEDRAEFEARYAADLRAAYPAGPHGTLLPFRRIFAVGRKH